MPKSTILEAENHQRALALKLVELKLRYNRDGRLLAAADLMEASPDGALSPEDFRTFKSAVDDASKYHQQYEMLEELRKRSAGMAAYIKSEPRTYGGAHPERSFFSDLISVSDPLSPDRRAATERLARHGKECAIEARSGSSEGQRARRAWAEAYRTEDPETSGTNAFDEELRAMSTGSSSGGALVTPQYVVSRWSEYRSPYRAFADQCLSLPMPAYGMEVYVPSFTGPSGVAQQVAENAGVFEVDPTGTYLSTGVVTLAGQSFVSQQLHDRGGMQGMAFDIILGQQLREQLDAALDSYVLVQALANAGTVTDASGFSIGNLYTDLSKARELLTDTAGTRVRGTHAFMTSDLWGHISAQLDSSNRPIITPDFTAEPWATLVAAGDPKGEGWSGHVLPGGAALFTDDNMPTTSSGANTQIIVARPQTICVWESEPIPIVYPESGATTLSVLIGLRAYAAAIPRLPRAVASISGNGYPVTLT